jgi:uncharacterized caspase-like protein
MPMLKALTFACLVAVSSLLTDPAVAEKRIALVIGNSNYANVRQLANPANDASAIAALLRRANFDLVEASNNLSGIEMRRAFRDFEERARGADIAVVYYAGHGIEFDGTNYLLPVDTVLKRDLDVEDEAVSLDRVIRTLEPARKLRLIILDACRDNPFVRTVRRTSETRSIGRGLAKIEPTSSNTLIAYAARAGSTAADGDAEHSPFAAALLQNLTTPGLDLRIALGRVRDAVLQTTGDRQEPFVYGSLGGATVSLVPDQNVAAAQPPATTAPVVFDAKADARRDYELAAQVNTKETWDSFLAIHDTGFYADLARGQRSKLLAEESKLAMRSAPAQSQSLPPAQSTSPPAPASALSSVQPTASPKPPEADATDTARQLNTELRRIGCYLGAVDASWGRDSRNALERFNKQTGARLDARVASLDALGVVRAKTGRVCPLECRPGYRADNDACVKIACRSGFVVGDDGQCEREKKPKSKTASRPDSSSATPAAPRNRREPATPRKQGEQGPAQVVCGRNGCLNVPRGCRGERIPAGRDEQAAVICN